MDQVVSLGYRADRVPSWRSSTPARSTIGVISTTSRAQSVSTPTADAEISSTTPKGLLPTTPAGGDPASVQPPPYLPNPKRSQSAIRADDARSLHQNLLICTKCESDENNFPRRSPGGCRVHRLIAADPPIHWPARRGPARISAYICYACNK